MRTPERSLGFDPWLHEISAQAGAALTADLDAEAVLLRIDAELEEIAAAIRNDTYPLHPPPEPVPAPPPRKVSTESLVRPYALPAEQAEPLPRLNVETLLTATELGLRRPEAAGSEWRWVIGLCQQARSVAEVAAYGSLPLGVARNVVGKLATAGLLDIQLPAPLTDDFGLHIVKRVLRSLRQL